MAKIDEPIPDAVLRTQARAADPARNIWLSANAGSGKTHVLTERVIRLLLADVDPAHILCLTYTKAAASVMQTRIFDRLSQWTRLSDEALAEQLHTLTGQQGNDAHLALARRLFARALETPGGLKIQTIHAFCEAILHQFPVEANIAGHFEMMDDMRAHHLVRAARRQLIEDAWQGVDPALSAAFELIMARVGEYGLDELLKQAIDRSEILKPHLTHFQKSGDRLFYQTFGLDETMDGLSRQLKRAALFSDEEMALLQKYGGKVTGDFIAILQKLRDEEDVRKFIPFILKAYYDSKKEKPRSHKQIVTKNLCAAWPDAENRFLAKQEKLAEGINKLRMIQLIELNVAALRLIEYLNKNYNERKRAHGLLDFDDLIHHTLALFKRQGAGLWVHYKLNHAISHILVDEAQDTSPAQWKIIRLLSDEFFTGEGAIEKPRTLFAVGDEKQSIYSFQGAVPENFAVSGAEFGKKARTAGRIFEPLQLNFSFRSTPDILAAVDRVFEKEENYKGLSALHERPHHQAIRARAPGEVDIWAPLKPQSFEEPEDWCQTVEQEEAPPSKLARLIAETIDNWLKKSEPIIGQGRLMQPGDIMVLVRSRDSFVHALARELKNRAVAVAGADRLHLNEHIAVRDLMALARFALQPHDDLSLACVLKSPLFDFNEDELYQLCTSRKAGEPLYRALEQFREMQSKTPPPDQQREYKFVAASEALTRYRAYADILPVYEFYSHILSEEGGRCKILCRLGNEASDVLDAFMDYSLAIQKDGLPGLQAFLESLAHTAPEIKRELGEARNEVRIMTVHAAKGLEAAVVFLVDNGKAIWNARRAPKWLKIKGKEAETRIPVWNPGKKYHTKAIEEALELIKQRETQEYRRLLYVGMTRAEDRLIVCGYKSKKSPTGTWLDLVSDALRCDAVPLIPPPAENIEAYRFRSSFEQLSLHQPAIGQIQPEELPAPPAFLFEKIASTEARPRPLSPSAAAMMLDGEEEIYPADGISAPWKNGDIVPSPSLAIRRGIITHHLLQYLPGIAPAQRLQLARNFIARQASDWPPEELQNMINDIFTLLEDERLQRLFTPASRAEVALMGHLQIGGVSRPVSGQIDRLAVFEDEILFADFKTGQKPQDAAALPRVYLLQMALYRSLLQILYPHHEIRALLIYTRDQPVIFELNNEKLDRLVEKP